MTDLKHYLQDGANRQARAVMCMVQTHNIESSWDVDWKEYKANPQIARWENCREQGYVISLTSKDKSRQVNIAFFEHRNSDSICAVKWEQLTLNSPHIDTADFGDQVYTTKWDVSYEVGYGEIVKMADWIVEEMDEFWDETTRPQNVE